jgi:hypothetical protein
MSFNKQISQGGHADKGIFFSFTIDNGVNERVYYY